jgi:anaerobic ribonucleoside-triphosphate reductase
LWSETSSLSLERLATLYPSTTQIRLLVEETLHRMGCTSTALAYTSHRTRSSSQTAHAPVVDVLSTINAYLDRSDWRINANANQGYSPGGLILNTAGKVIANYWLSEVYPAEIGRAHREGELHIHDLDMLAGYCAGWSLRVLLEEGLNGEP